MQKACILDSDSITFVSTTTQNNNNTMKSTLAPVRYAVMQLTSSCTVVSSPEFRIIHQASIWHFEGRYEVTHPSWYNQEFCYKTLSGALKKAKQLIKSEVIDERYNELAVMQRRVMG